MLEEETLYSFYLYEIYLKYLDIKHINPGRVDQLLDIKIFFKIEGF